MAVPSNTVTTYNFSGGQREDLEDVIYNTSPTETPIITAMKKGKAEAKFHEWLTDTLAAPAENAHLDGDDSAADSYTSPYRLGNRTQILKKVVVVSGSQEAVNKAGRRSEIAYELQKRSREIKRDLEYAVAQNSAAVAGTSSTVRKMAGMETWLSSNKDSHATGTTPGSTDGAPTTAPTDGTTVRTFTESLLETVLQSIWDEGGDPNTLTLGKFNKGVFSGFGGIATQYRDNPKNIQGTIIAGADVYVGDFGELVAVPCRQVRDRTAMIIDWDYWKLCALRPFFQEKLAKTGDAEKYHIVGEYTLACLNEKASGKVADLATS
jgi:hypothetical protein